MLLQKPDQLTRLIRNKVSMPYSKMLLVARPLLTLDLPRNVDGGVRQALPAPLFVYIEGSEVKVREKYCRVHLPSFVISLATFPHNDLHVQRLHADLLHSPEKR